MSVKVKCKGGEAPLRISLLREFLRKVQRLSRKQVILIQSDYILVPREIKQVFRGGVPLLNDKLYRGTMSSQDCSSGGAKFLSGPQCGIRYL